MRGCSASSRISRALSRPRASAAASASRHGGVPHATRCIAATASLILLRHAPQVEYVVAPDEHLAEIARKLPVDPLLRARQLRGTSASRKVRASLRESSRVGQCAQSPASSCTNPPTPNNLSTRGDDIARVERRPGARCARVPPRTLVFHAPLELSDDRLASQVVQEWLRVDRDLRGWVDVSRARAKRAGGPRAPST